MFHAGGASRTACEPTACAHFGGAGMTRTNARISGAHVIQDGRASQLLQHLHHLFPLQDQVADAVIADPLL